MSENSFLMEAQTMRPLNEIIQSLKEKYGYTEQEIDALSQKLDKIIEFALMDNEQKRLSDNE